MQEDEEVTGSDLTPSSNTLSWFLHDYPLRLGLLAQFLSQIELGVPPTEATGSQRGIAASKKDYNNEILSLTETAEATEKAQNFMEGLG